MNTEIDQCASTRPRLEFWTCRTGTRLENELYQKVLATQHKDLNNTKSQAWRHTPMISGWELKTGGSWGPHSQRMSQGKWQSWKFREGRKSLPQGNRYATAAQKGPGQRSLVYDKTMCYREVRTLCFSDNLSCCATPRATQIPVWPWVSISPAYLTSGSHHGLSWLGKMLGSSQRSQPSMNTREHGGCPSYSLCSDL